MALISPDRSSNSSSNSGDTFSKINEFIKNFSKLLENPAIQKKISETGENNNPQIPQQPIPQQPYQTQPTPQQTPNNGSNSSQDINFVDMIQKLIISEKGREKLVKGLKQLKQIVGGDTTINELIEEINSEELESTIKALKGG